MSSRYEKIFSTEENLYAEGLPFILEARALYTDNKTNGAAAQLKFRSISNSRISAVKIFVDAFDIFGEKIESCEFQYLSLAVKRDDRFGQKIPIEFSNKNIRSYTVKIINVVFADGSIANFTEEEMKPLKRAGDIINYFEDTQLLEQFNINIRAQGKVFPIDCEDLWVCACGEINKKIESECYHCKNKKIDIVSNLSFEKLKKDIIERKKEEQYIEATKCINGINNKTTYEIIGAIKVFKALKNYKDAESKVIYCENFLKEREKYLKQRKIEEEQRAEEERIEKEIRKKITRKITIISVLTLFFIIIFIKLLISYIIPEVKYIKASKYYENKNYEDSIHIYEDLMDYKDSKNKVFEVGYSWAEEHFSKGEFEKALTVYERLEDYKDSKEKAKESRYNIACKNLKNNAFNDAYNDFLLIKTYKDSEQKIQESGLEYAKELVEVKEYKKAVEVLDVVGTYKDSKELIKNCYLEISREYYKTQNYISTIEWYEKIPEFDKGLDIYIDSCYNCGVECINSKKFEEAVAWFDKYDNNYKDTKYRVREAKYGYVDNNKVKSNNTTLKYLKELKASKYKDSEAIYNDLYGWKVEIISNNDISDKNTNKGTLSKYDKWHFYICLTGGEPEATTELTVVGYFPDGSKENVDMQAEKIGDGEAVDVWFGYEYPVYGLTGKFELHIYDDNGNLIGNKMIWITV